MEKKAQGRILVNIDVHELGPIELEVRLFQDVVGGRQCLGRGGNIGRSRRVLREIDVKC